MNGKIYTIMSLVPQNGAKYIATNIGYYANKHIKKSKVLLVDLDSHSPMLASHYVKNSQYNIDDLVPFQDTLTKQILKEKITKTSVGFDVLKGTEMREQDYVSPEIVAKALILAKEMYTHIFVVASPDLSSPNVVMSVLNSERLMIVLRNNYGNELVLGGLIASLNPYLSDEVPLDVIFNYRDFNHTLQITENIAFKNDKKVNYLGFVEYDGKTVDNTNIGENSILKRGNTNKKLFKTICKNYL